MIIISHRGNLQGVNPTRENSVEYIEEALKMGLHVEIDLRVFRSCFTKRYYLGHDGPQYEIQPSFLLNDKLFIHCKNIEAIMACKEMGVKHYFFHDRDDATLTSSGYIWTYPDSTIQITTMSIPVVFDRQTMIWNYKSLMDCAGICTDDPLYYQSILEVPDPSIYS